jgi:hypothetical protein
MRCVLNIGQEMEERLQERVTLKAGKIESSKALKVQRVK